MRSFSCALFALAVGVLIAACNGKYDQKKPGDACRAGSGPSDVVCADGASVGSCRGFTWHVDPCRGPAGCSSGVCDQSIAAANDSCGIDGALACSADGSELVRCEHGTMVTERKCRGERGCYRTSMNATPSCDIGAPQVGDACTPTAGGRCSADGKAVLQCSPQTHHVVLERNCLGPKGCFANPHFHESGRDFIACDVSMGNVGQPCIGYAGFGARIGDGGSYCSIDGTQLLTCKDGVLVSQRSCDCSVTWESNRAAWSVGCSDRRSFGEAAYLSLAEKP